MHIKHFAILAILLLSLSATFAVISTDDAISIVSTTNNYLMPGETATAVRVPITYLGQKYIVVAAKKGDSVTAYIPVRASDGNIAAKDIEIIGTIKTAIVFTEMTQLKESTSTGDWLFSYSTKNFFYDLQNDFSDLTGNLVLIQTELGKLGSDAGTLTGVADDTEMRLEQITASSKAIAEEMEKGRVAEESFLATPDTNMVAAYQNSYEKLFIDLDKYRKDYATIAQNLTQLNTGIGGLATNKITIDQKKSLQSLLSTPVSARKLDSFFGTTDQLRTVIEGVFNDGQNSNAYVSNLATRRTRNDAWLVLYGPNDALQKLDPSFTTLEAAANGVLSENNVDQWNNQDAVTALKGSWNTAGTKFNNAEYEKAKENATKSVNYIKQIMADGVKTTSTGTDMQDLAIKIVAGLVVLMIAAFIFETFVVKKKKKEEKEQYDEP